MVFIHATGDTHALSIHASGVMSAMRSRPDLALSAHDWYAQAFGADAADAEPGEEMMKGLEAIGLVQRGPS